MQVVEGAGADQGIDLVLGHGIGVVFVGAVAHQAIVGGYLGDEVLVDIEHAHSTGVIVVACGEGHGDGNLFDLGDFHHESFLSAC